MVQTTPSASNSLTSEELIVRLSAHDAVEGLVVIGSAARDEVTPANDYDLVVVLSEMPVPLHVSLTCGDGRVADIIFVTVEQIDQVLSLSGPVDARDWIGRIVRWLQVGCIAFDRSGRLERAQR